MCLPIFLLVTYLCCLTVFSNPLKRAIECPQNFRNVVFNSGVNSEPNWPGRFDSIQTYGISSWIGFTASPAGNADTAVNAGQIRLMMETSDVNLAISTLSDGGPAPDYWEMFNEPDGGFYGQPVISPDEAAAAVKPLLMMNTTTKFISPAPAYPVGGPNNQTWLQQFFTSCGALCEQRIPYVAAHIYAAEAADAISVIQNVHSQFPTKHIWITELAPAPNNYSNCNLDVPGMQNWMTTVLTYAAQTGYVDRVFWNSGEYGVLYPDNPGLCNPSLTEEGLDAQGNSIATPLLDTYKSLCA